MTKLLRKIEIAGARYKRELREEFSDFTVNGFGAVQTGANIVLCGAGLLQMEATGGAEGGGTTATGAANTVRNSIWAFSAPFARAFAKTTLGKDIAQTRSNAGGAVAAMLSNWPMFQEGLSTGNAGITVAGGAAVTAYGLMAVDQAIESHRLRLVWEGTGSFRHQLITMDERDFFVGYKERAYWHGKKGRPMRSFSNHTQEFAFNALPGSILIVRALAFLGTGVAALQSAVQNQNEATNLAQAGSASLMLTAGCIFIFGAVRELQKQNSLIRPLKPVHDDVTMAHYNGTLRTISYEEHHMLVSGQNIERLRQECVCYISVEDLDSYKTDFEPD